MDSNTDDHDPELPPDVPADELQQALQWLEELTGPSGSVPAADETADSPFQGLVDDGAGDLPDWLREAPQDPVEARLADEGEFESRLDWLAKMAERESIEELPTLEWRNLSDTLPPHTADEAAYPTDETLLPPFTPEPLPVEATPPEPLTVEAVLRVPELLPDEPPPPADALEAVALLPDEPIMPPAAEEPAAFEPLTPITPEALLDTLPPDEELPPIDDLDAAMAWIEELAASQDAPIEDVPSVADRALASKLLMEAGLSPDGLDRRLTGDEMALGDLSLLEGNTPVNAFVAAEDFADTIVLVETMAADQGRSLPEDFPVPETADTAEGSFAEAMAFLDDLAADQEPLGAQTQPLEAIDAAAVGVGLFVSDELSLAEEPPAAWATADEEVAAPWLAEPEDAAEPESAQAVETIADVTEPDEIEPEWVVVEVDTVEPEGTEATETMDEMELDAALSIGDAPWLEQAAEEPVVEWREPEADRSIAAEFVPVAATATVLAAEGVNANGNTGATLEETLRALDALALPPGRSLAEFDASLAQAPVRRDLPAAVEWLELALGISVPAAPPTPQWSDDELITQMPDDPDAVLAWLEQLAEEDTVDSSPQLSPATEALSTAGQPPASGARLDRAAAPEQLIDELSAADLQNMPDDPDAVMAWLEGLAGGHDEALAAPPSAPARPEVVLPSVSPTPPVPSTTSAADQTPPAASSRSRRRRGRRSQQSVTAAQSDAAAGALPMAEAGDTPDWQMADEVGAPDVTTVTAMPDAPPVVAGALAWEAIDELAVPDFIEAMVTPDAPPVEVVDAPAWEEMADIAAPDAPPVVVAGVPAWEATDEVAAPDVTIEGAESAAAALSEAADVVPTVEAEVDEPAVTWVEEALAAPEAAGEPPVEPVALALPARPRRRGRKPKAVPETSGAAAEFTVVDEASDVAETQPQPLEIEETPQPAKPASWVDLLKPLK